MKNGDLKKIRNKAKEKRIFSFGLAAAKNYWNTAVFIQVGQGQKFWFCTFAVFCAVFVVQSSTFCSIFALFGRWYSRFGHFSVTLHKKFSFGQNFVPGPPHWKQQYQFYTFPKIRTLPFIGGSQIIRQMQYISVRVKNHVLTTAAGNHNISEGYKRDIFSHIKYTFYHLQKQTKMGFKKLKQIRTHASSLSTLHNSYCEWAYKKK